MRMSGGAMLLWMMISLIGHGTCLSAVTQKASRDGSPGPLRPLCNGHADLCDRRFSNITHVAAHNSPFNEFGNPGSNQVEDVETQLNDGVRMLQFQTRVRDGVVHMCHTSCWILDAGPLVDLLRLVMTWLSVHPYEVVTLLMGNGDRIPAANFTSPMVDSGLVDYVYEPPQGNMDLDSWPTLADMIQNGTRAVVMLDYGADARTVPYLIDEFAVMWETPFSPTDATFPCTPDRPPGANESTRRSTMIMANHNLNQNFSIGGQEILVPEYDEIYDTNADQGNGSVGEAVARCIRDWNRPPTFILVDFYRQGNFPGSVMSAAAAANGIDSVRPSVNGALPHKAGCGKTEMALIFTLLWLISELVL
ncbi:uncharacterized protein A1O9_13047 [Exophiala aquamarina CBS 119918]|uniref:Phosphatidylinositol-specific phospholipase C X domain-containing protein n=1 Tax=Exophiala aquamarina CBS 119918 TaxID=1182545 RepID=A0A072NV34_9EURO|nr:uncharacterized protein A1O9_13047 [Exophiala aquamarina CBS 119918]KEF50898.1 hypothetical protein A1O9_13047 [Exophiala aquamarina CBS 119918]